MAVQRKLTVTVADIISYSQDVKIFRLVPQKKLPRFKAGQFLHLAIEPYDPSFNWPESRVFSIANSPTRTEFIDILVSRIGGFTLKMFDILKKGSEVWIKLPYGIFNFDESLDRNTVLIAGGTGISPFISFLQYAIDKNLNPAIHLYYGVKTPELIIIDKLIVEAAGKLSDFKYQIFVEQMSSKTSLNIYSGILDIKRIVDSSLKLRNPIFYLSGPPAMIAAFENALKNCGISPQNIKYDNWN